MRCPISSAHPGRQPVGLWRLPAERWHARAAGGDFRLDRPPLWRDAGEDRLMVLNGTREGLFNACHRAVPGNKGREPAGGPDAEPVLPGLCRRGADRGGRAGLCPGHRRHRHSCPIMPACPLTCWTGWRWPISARPPIRRARWPPGLSGRPAGAGRKARFHRLADECYSEIWRDARPPACLRSPQGKGPTPNGWCSIRCPNGRTCRACGRALSPPGRSMLRIRKLRAFAGAPLPLPLQRVAEAAWADEAHVAASRALYQEKFADADAVFAGMQGYRAPAAGSSCGCRSKALTMANRRR
jgi:N-succinyldiaminopimelate aminotransferase